MNRDTPKCRAAWPALFEVGRPRLTKCGPGPGGPWQYPRSTTVLRSTSCLGARRCRHLLKSIRLHTTPFSYGRSLNTACSLYPASPLAPCSYFLQNPGSWLLPVPCHQNQGPWACGCGNAATALRPGPAVAASGGKWQWRIRAQQRLVLNAKRDGGLPSANGHDSNYALSAPHASSPS